MLRQRENLTVRSVSPGVLANAAREYLRRGRDSQDISGNLMQPINPRNNQCSFARKDQRKARAFIFDETPYFQEQSLNQFVGELGAAAFMHVATVRIRGTKSISSFAG